MRSSSDKKKYRLRRYFLEMPTYIDVIKFEDEAPANTIRLVKSGEFYRAYNHSAWLFQLKKLIPKISVFLQNNLGLKLHPYKTRIYNAYYGIKFLGAYVKPFRTYISSSTFKRIKTRINNCEINDNKHLQSSINSFLGVLSHYDSYCLRRVVFGNNERLNRVGEFNKEFLKFR